MTGIFNQLRNMFQELVQDFKEMDALIQNISPFKAIVVLICSAIMIRVFIKHPKVENELIGELIFRAQQIISLIVIAYVVKTWDGQILVRLYHNIHWVTALGVFLYINFDRVLSKLKEYLLEIKTQCCLRNPVNNNTLKINA